MKATAGNFAFGIGGKMEIELGPCARFAIYHLMDLKPGEERLHGGLVRASVATIGRGQPKASTTEFRESITRFRGSLPVPSTNTAVSLVEYSSPDDTATRPPRTLSDLARVLRSKNAGPFDITIDVIFATAAQYEAVERSGVLSREAVAAALGIAQSDIVWLGFFEPALAFKVTIPRVRRGKKAAAGGFMENDVHGSQQHLGLATLELPEGLIL